MSAGHYDMFAYQTALHLNNAAISLMERGYYRPAMATLRDAASMMRDLCSCLNHQGCPTSESDSLLQIANSLKLQRKSLDASRWLERSQVSETKRGKGKAVRLHVISEDDDAPTIASGGADGTEQPTVLICLSCAVVNELPNEVEMSAKTSVILYNLGIAARCLAQTIPTQNCRQKLELRAFHIFKFAYATALNGRESVCTEEKLHRKLMLLRPMLYHLVYLSHKYGKDRQFQEYSKSLQKLNSWVNALCEMQTMSQTHASAA